MFGLRSNITLNLDVPVYVVLKPEQEPLASEHYTQAQLEEVLSLRRKIISLTEERDDLKGQLQRMESHLDDLNHSYSKLSQDSLVEAEDLRQQLQKEKKLKNYYVHQLQGAGHQVKPDNQEVMKNQSSKPPPFSRVPDPPNAGIQSQHSEVTSEGEVNEQSNIWTVVGSAGWRKGLNPSSTSSQVGSKPTPIQPHRQAQEIKSPDLVSKTQKSLGAPANERMSSSSSRSSYNPAFSKRDRKAPGQKPVLRADAPSWRK